MCLPKHAPFTTAWVAMLPSPCMLKENVIHPHSFKTSSVYGSKIISFLVEDPWLEMLSLTGHFVFFLIFQYLTVVQCCNTRKRTRPETDPWCRTSVTNMKYYLFLPTSVFSNNVWPLFRVQVHPKNYP